MKAYLCLNSSTVRLGDATIWCYFLASYPTNYIILGKCCSRLGDGTSWRYFLSSYPANYIILDKCCSQTWMGVEKSIAIFLPNTMNKIYGNSIIRRMGEHCQYSFNATSMFTIIWSALKLQAIRCLRFPESFSFGTAMTAEQLIIPSCCAAVVAVPRCTL